MKFAVIALVLGGILLLYAIFTACTPYPKYPYTDNQTMICI